MSEPDRLYIAKEDRELYDKLQGKWIFKGRSKKEQFVFAMAFGFGKGVRRVIERREEFFHRPDLRLEDKAILDIVAIQTEGSLSILLNIEQVFQIAQEYAHAGIQLLNDEFESSPLGTFEKKFERDMFDLYNKLKPSQ